jgi:hypothetical protein
MTRQEDPQSLLIWSQRSNNIYTANGVCQCRAFEQVIPCFHRAVARLVPLYVEAENAPTEVRRQAEEIPYLKNNRYIKAERFAPVRIN